MILRPQTIQSCFVYAPLGRMQGMKFCLAEFNTVRYCLEQPLNQHSSCTGPVTLLSFRTSCVRPSTFSQTPESSCRTSGAHRSQASHPCVRIWLPVFCTAALTAGPFSTNIIENPWDWCQAKWQCASQMPGLSSLNAKTRWPALGRVAVSRRGGLIAVRCVVPGSYAPDP